ncbi:CPBP family intramembrane glutamic endopeptidase [Pseudomonas chlororaphis]|uniref:CPBP family intramembrane glutamic endopeptidase n=2 Tax=Pseudomonas chlororaphis TaxID=587753 RepID=UPI0013DE29E2|nr:type II CAAX endopeptidase family protein [Pseudomonas chlororaphis]
MLSALCMTIVLQLYLALVYRTGESLWVAGLVVAAIGLALIWISAALRPVEGACGCIGWGAALKFTLVLFAVQLIHSLASYVATGSFFGALPKSTELLTQLFVLVFAGPIFEEAIFRQYLFRAFYVGQSRLAQVVPVASTTIFFTIFHYSYWGTYSLFLIIALGIILGLARVRAGGVVLPIGLHILSNMYAVLGAVKWP